MGLTAAGLFNSGGKIVRVLVLNTQRLDNPARREMLLGLESLGVEALDLRLPPERLTEESLLEEVDRFRPDLYLTVRGRHVPSGAVRKIAERGIPTAMWIEHIAPRIEPETVALARAHDFFFTTVADMVPVYQGEGVRNAFHLMQGFQPEAYFPNGIPAVAASGDHVLFTGRIDADYRYRAALLKAVLKTGVDLKWYGERVPLTFRTLGFHLRYRDLLRRHQGGKAFLEDFARAVAQARVVLALHKYRNLRMGFSNRIWMILGCGGFYLGEKVAGQEEIFRTGMELETFSNREEMTEKIRYYWDRPEERRRIAAAGQAKVLEHHTYAHRFRDMFATIARERPAFALPP